MKTLLIIIGALAILLFVSCFENDKDYSQEIYDLIMKIDYLYIEEAITEEQYNAVYVFMTENTDNIPPNEVDYEFVIAEVEEMLEMYMNYNY